MKGDIDKDLARENLRRISTNFELDLLRLIKTLNLISQSRELYKNQIDRIETLTEKYKSGLNVFTVKLLDAERKSSSPSSPSLGDPYSPPGEPLSQVQSFTGIIDELRGYLDDIGTEIEKLKKEHLDKLDSVYSVYNLELGASQTDLDAKLLGLQNELTRLAASGIYGAEQKKEQNGRTAEKTDSKEIDENKKDIIAPPGTKPETAKKAVTPDTASAKTKPSFSSSDSKPTEDEDKNSALKSTYVIGAGLLIFGVIIGVLFYDLLMRRWGVLEYTEQEMIDVLGSGEITANGGAPVPETDGTTDRLAEEAPDTVQPDGIDTPDASALLEEWAESGKIPGGAESDAIDNEAEKVVQSSEADEETATEPPAPDYKSYTVQGAGANVRSGPGMNHSIVTVVKRGQEFKGTGKRQGRWYKIIAPDGKEGWISGKIIREVK
ncbi:MAG: SH3 domain-containing protein [Deltaproteobacteria bacterium]